MGSISFPGFPRSLPDQPNNLEVPGELAEWRSGTVKLGLRSPSSQEEVRRWEVKPEMVGKEAHLTLALPGATNSPFYNGESSVQGPGGVLVATLAYSSSQGVIQRASGEWAGADEAPPLTLPPPYRWAALDPQRRKSLTPSCPGLPTPLEMALVMTYMVQRIQTWCPRSPWLQPSSYCSS